MRLPFAARRREAEVNEFRPDALEIQHAPLPWWADSVLLGLVCFFFAALAWACLGKVDVIITAQGKIISQSPPIELRPLERTVLKAVKVRVGDQVRKGQVLMTFDPVFTAAEAEKLDEEVKKYSAQRDRLAAELEGRDYAPASDSVETRWQQTLFLARKKLYRENLASYDEDIERITLSFRDKSEQLALYRDMENLYRKTKGAISLKEIKELQLSRMQLEADMRSLLQERLAAQAKRNAFVEEWQARVVEELVQIQLELTARRKELEKTRQLQAYVSLCAPEDGVVHTIAPVSIGSAVREVEPLLTLVPLHQGLEAEVSIPTEYIGKVAAGHDARLKLAAFPFQKYGTLDGTVRYISRDAFTETAEDGGKRLRYMARITIDANALERKREEGLFILPGMELTAEILAGKRRIIEYLTYPLIKSLDEAMREP